jgi:hypothetical protein
MGGRISVTGGAQDWLLFRLYAYWKWSVRELHARVGIASGQVVVGDLESAGVTQAGVISGETPNLAARIQTRCQRGSGCDFEPDAPADRCAFDLDKLGDRR